MRKLGLIASGVLLIFSGCALPRNSTATKSATTANASAATGKSGGNPTATANAVKAASNPAVKAEPRKARPMKHRKLVIDETGNAYQMLDEGEGMCDDCDL